MKVLVVGASGLVGNSVCREFLSNNFIVTGLVYKASALIDHINYKEISINLISESLSIISNKFDLVIHCAAIIPNGNLSDEELFINNQNIDMNVFLFCKTHNILLIYFSTVFFYNEENTGSISESCSIRKDLSGYYLSKRTSENYLINSNITSTIFRLSSPYGDLGKQENVMKFFDFRIKNNLSITLYGKGEREQNFIHVDDISKASYLAFINNITGIYNLNYKKSYSMYELALIIKKHYKSTSEFIYDYEKIDFKMNVNFSNLKLKNTFNWEPQYDLYQGISKMLR